MCLNSFLSSRNYSCPEEELGAVSWEPKAEAKVKGSSILFVHQVTFFPSGFAQLNPHPYLQLTETTEKLFRKIKLKKKKICFSKTNSLS